LRVYTKLGQLKPGPELVEGQERRNRGEGHEAIRIQSARKHNANVLSDVPGKRADNGSIVPCSAHRPRNHIRSKPPCGGAHRQGHHRNTHRSTGSVLAPVYVLALPTPTREGGVCLRNSAQQSCVWPCTSCLPPLSYHSERDTQIKHPVRSWNLSVAALHAHEWFSLYLHGM
jgi:hypothetical protein